MTPSVLPAVASIASLPSSLLESHARWLPAALAASTAPIVVGDGAPGLPGVSIPWIVLVAVACGVAPSVFGGRLPSLHDVAPAYARRVNIWHKLAHEVLRATLHRNIDAAALSILSRVDDTLAAVMAGAADAASRVSVEHRAVVWIRAVLGAAASKLVPSVVATASSAAHALVTSTVSRLLVTPVNERLLPPVLNALRRLCHNCFGHMSVPAAQSFLVTSTLVTAVHVAIEYNRQSWLTTMALRRRSEGATLAAHALFAASLSVLRWRLYCGGWGWWRVVAAESAVRIAVSVVELFAARLAYRRPERHPLEVHD